MMSQQGKTTRCKRVARRAFGCIAFVVTATLGCEPATLHNSSPIASSNTSTASSESAASSEPKSQSWSTEAVLKEAGFNPNHIAKNQTLLIVVAPNDVKTTTLAFSSLPFMSSEQRQQCKRIVATYEADFDSLLAERTEILEHLGESRDTKYELLLWKISVARLTRSIRQRLNAEVLTKEQRKAKHEAYLKKLDLERP